MGGAIQCCLECLPQGLVPCEMAPVCQGLGGCLDAGIKQELADVLVAGTGSFLQQLLDGCAGTNVDAFGLGTVAGTHRSSRKGAFGIPIIVVRPMSRQQPSVCSYARGLPKKKARPG